MWNMYELCSDSDEYSVKVMVNESRGLCECVGAAQPGWLQCGRYVCTALLLLFCHTFCTHPSV